MADTGVSYKSAVSFFRGKLAIFIQQNYPAVFTYFFPPFAAAQQPYEKITSDESHSKQSHAQTMGRTTAQTLHVKKTPTLDFTEAVQRYL